MANFSEELADLVQKYLNAGIPLDDIVSDLELKKMALDEESGVEVDDEDEE